MPAKIDKKRVMKTIEKTTGKQMTLMEVSGFKDFAERQWKRQQ